MILSWCDNFYDMIDPENGRLKNLVEPKKTLKITFLPITRPRRLKSTFKWCLWICDFSHLGAHFFRFWDQFFKNGQNFKIVVFHFFEKKTSFFLVKTVENSIFLTNYRQKWHFKILYRFFDFNEEKKLKIDFRGQFWLKNGFVGGICLVADYIF